MAITDAQAVDYSNSVLRPASDKIARSYRLIRNLVEAWDAIAGTNDEKAALLGGRTAEIAERVASVYFFCHKAARLWDALAINPLYPNDPLEILYDNSDQTGPDPNRPQVSGQDLRRARVQMLNFVAWLEQGEFDMNSVATVDYAKLRQMLLMGREGARTPTTGQIRNVVKVLADEWKTEYVTTSPAALRHLDTVGVNTGTELD